MALKLIDDLEIEIAILKAGNKLEQEEANKTIGMLDNKITNLEKKSKQRELELEHKDNLITNLTKALEKKDTDLKWIGGSNKFLDMLLMDKQESIEKKDEMLKKNNLTITELQQKLSKYVGNQTMKIFDKFLRDIVAFMLITYISIFYFAMIYENFENTLKDKLYELLVFMCIHDRPNDSQTN